MVHAGSGVEVSGRIELIGREEGVLMKVGLFIDKFSDSVDKLMGW